MEFPSTTIGVSAARDFTPGQTERPSLEIDKRNEQQTFVYVNNGQTYISSRPAGRGTSIQNGRGIYSVAERDMGSFTAVDDEVSSLRTRQGVTHIFPTTGYMLTIPSIRRQDAGYLSYIFDCYNPSFMDVVLYVPWGYFGPLKELLQLRPELLDPKEEEIVGHVSIPFICK